MGTDEGLIDERGEQECEDLKLEEFEILRKQFENMRKTAQGLFGK